jgi:predicted CXXCH cytochrome family protein
MKKVLVLVAAISLFAAPAFAAGITNTKHNLSSASGNTLTSNNQGELCVFCHTPHGAATGLNAPLWNRTNPANLLVTNLYNSVTLDQTNSNPTNVLNSVNTSDALLCLSCHDGASLGGALKNPSNSAAAQPDFGAVEITGMANIGIDLKNDHPIGMNYSAVAADSGVTEFVAPVAGVVGGLNLYGGVMWCSSCHDVHNGANAPFLAKANDGSALCLSCHVK